MNSIELFSGTGGLALGLQQAGFDHKALFEWDKASCENIKENIANGYPGVRDWKVYQTDVRTVSYDGYTGNIQLVAGGPPCQPFSLGGKHQAYNDKRDMFPEAVRAVRETQPEAFIFENVKGLLRKSFSSYFNYILLQLQHPEIVKKENMTWEEHMSILEKHHTTGHDDGLSYNVVFRLLNAADYGVPQSRHRVIIVGFRSDSNISWSFPKASHSQEALLYSKWVTGDYWQEHDMKKPSEMPLSTAQLRSVRRAVEETDTPLQRWQTVRDAIGDLPNPADEHGVGAYYNHEFRDGARIYVGHALYYLGDFPAYEVLAEVNRNGQYACPIYVGKAVPNGARKGGQGDDVDPGTALFKRLTDHAKSVDAATNLKLEDFRCRFLSVDDI